MVLVEKYKLKSSLRLTCVDDLMKNLIRPIILTLFLSLFSYFSWYWVNWYSAGLVDQIDLIEFDMEDDFIYCNDWRPELLDKHAKLKFEYRIQNRSNGRIIDLKSAPDRIQVEHTLLTYPFVGPKIVNRLIKLGLDPDVKLWTKSETDLLSDEQNKEGIRFLRSLIINCAEKHLIDLAKHCDFKQYSDKELIYILEEAFFHGYDEFINYLFSTDKRFLKIIQNENINKNLIKICIHFGYLSTLKILDSHAIELNFKPNEELNFDCSIAYAANRNHVHVIKYLLDKGVPYADRLDEYTPLAIAAKKGHFESVKFFVENGYYKLKIQRLTVV